MTQLLSLLRNDESWVAANVRVFNELASFISRVGALVRKYVVLKSLNVLGLIAIIDERTPERITAVFNSHTHDALLVL